MKTRILTILSIFVLILLSSCYYDSEEMLYPVIDQTCDTTNITFSVTITKIMSENCWSCHAATYKVDGKGLRYDTYDKIANNIDDIIAAINHADGYTGMPKNSAMLKPCYRKQFQIWKDNNTPNN